MEVLHPIDLTSTEETFVLYKLAVQYELNSQGHTTYTDFPGCTKESCTLSQIHGVKVAFRGSRLKDAI